MLTNFKAARVIYSLELSHDLEDYLVNELILFADYIKSDPDGHVAARVTANESFEQASYSVLSGSAQLKDAFANVEIMYRIYLSLMSTNCSGERSFSKLGRVKSTMGQRRLKMLCLMSVEREILRSLDFTECRH